MKILYITNGINGSGGLERVLSIKTSFLAEYYGYEVSILVLNDAHQEPFYEFSQLLRFYSIQVGGNFLTYCRKYKNGIQKIINDLQPDIISVCDDGLKGFFVPSLIRTKAKVIYERHASVMLNTDSSLKGKIIRFLMQRQISKFDKFVVLTDSNIKEWKGDNVISIPNPMSFESERASSLEYKKVIVVGSHSYNKGYDLLLKSWEQIESHYSEWQLHIYGKFDKCMTFIYMKDNMRLKRVFFHQPVQDIQEKYLKSSIMVLSSRSEGFGMVLIEAMSCGLPCVSFDCPSGPRDIIRDKEDGFLVKAEDVQELSDKIALLIDNEGLRKKMGKIAFKNVKRFSISNILQQWEHLFKELV